MNGEAEITRDQTTARAATLNEEQRQAAMKRFGVLRPHLEEEVPLALAAQDAGVALRTVQRWLARYRGSGLAGLARPVRGDAGARRAPAELVALIEGMALKKPRASIAGTHRRIAKIAIAQGWRVPSYSTIYAILTAIDPAVMTLAHEGAAVFRDKFEMIHRHRASGNPP